jgi:hypothetical protein
MTMNIGGNANLGLNGITKRVGAGAEAAKEATKTTGTGGFANDNLVRTGSTAAATGSAGAAGAKALNDLAEAYDANPAQFAYNLAAKALNDVASLIG